MTHLMMGLDSTVDHGLVLRFYDLDTKPGEGIQKVAFEYVVDPKDQPDLLRSIANSVTQNLTDVMLDVQRGDCPTCKNIRLVDVELSNGRKTNEYCPDCMAGKQPEAFDGYPIVGGGLAPRQEEE